ncbi:MAG: hypothetical protein Q4A37_02905 [Candidatus Saccharibacteria bacterium]|nr:hypothetical protein [Candidatus Saccharibacteria bacterium]
MSGLLDLRSALLRINTVGIFYAELADLQFLYEYIFQSASSREVPSDLRKFFEDVVLSIPIEEDRDLAALIFAVGKYSSLGRYERNQEFARRSGVAGWDAARKAPFDKMVAKFIARVRDVLADADDTKDAVDIKEPNVGVMIIKYHAKYFHDITKLESPVIQTREIEALVDGLEEYTWTSSNHWCYRHGEPPVFTLIEPLEDSLSVEIEKSWARFNGKVKGHTARCTVRFARPLKKGERRVIAVKRVERHPELPVVTGLQYKEIVPLWPIQEAEIEVFFAESCRPIEAFVYENLFPEQPRKSEMMKTVELPLIGGALSCSWKDIQTGRAYGIAWRLRNGE